MKKLLILLVLIASYALAIDYYTVELLSTTSNEEATALTTKFKGLGFDAFTQVRPDGKGLKYLSCINKFKSKEDALMFARNLKHLEYYKQFEVTLVLSKKEWISRFAKKPQKRLPAETSKLNLNPKQLPTRTLASLVTYTPNSFEGTPFGKVFENPVMKGQKFVSTEKGLWVSIPTSNGDHWEQVSTPFNAANIPMHFTNDGTLYIGKYKLGPKQEKFVEAIDFKKLHLTSYFVSQIYQKEGLLWYLFSKKKGDREPASIDSKLNRVFISADYGNKWSELPSIVEKDFE